MAGVGGGYEALRPAGAGRATKDPATADQLYRERLAELEQNERRQKLLGVGHALELADMAAARFRALLADPAADRTWIRTTARYLDLAVDFFTEEQFKLEPESEDAAARDRWLRREGLAPGSRNLLTITPPDVRSFDRWLAQRAGRRGERWSEQTRRHALNALSGVYRQAHSDGYLAERSNPVAALLQKPSGGAWGKTPLREMWELAVLLESARTAGPLLEERGSKLAGCIHELVAFFLLTAARDGEVRRVQVSDLSFRPRLITIRSARKGGRARAREHVPRAIPMHEQLAEILLPYVARLGRISGPLFPLGSGDWQGALDLVAMRAGFPAGHFTTRMFRTAYATWRCTCDGIDVARVRDELRHSDLKTASTYYVQAQMQPERMGPEMAYRIERWRGHPEVDRRLAAMDGWKPPRQGEHSAETVRAFLAAVEGSSSARVQAETRVSRAVVERLRAGSQELVKGRTLKRMREHLAASETAPAAAAAILTPAERARVVAGFLSTSAGMPLESLAAQTGVAVGTLKDLRQGRTDPARLHHATLVALRAWLARQESGEERRAG
ncbi:MAG TPA: site-specific integrase [Acetobacteraceae bacterium]|nr:site-specific integrase [Acetobacteraceae bacterium]